MKIPKSKCAPVSSEEVKDKILDLAIEYMGALKRESQERKVAALTMNARYGKLYPFVAVKSAYPSEFILRDALKRMVDASDVGQRASATSAIGNARKVLTQSRRKP